VLKQVEVTRTNLCH